MNAVEAELTMRLASSTAGVREAARPKLVELLRHVDSRAYSALLAEGTPDPARFACARAGARSPRRRAPFLGRGRTARRAPARAEARRRLRRVVEAMQEGGIRTLPIKGTTLGRPRAQDPGLRPTTDVEVGVPLGTDRSAVETFRAMGHPRGCRVDARPLADALHVHE
jgi:hypothetical protein